MSNSGKATLVVDARMVNVSGIGTVCQNILTYLKNDFDIILLGNPNELRLFDWATGLKVIWLKSSIYSLKEQLELFYKIPPCHYFLSPHYNIPLLPIRAKKRIVIIHDVNHIALAKTINAIKNVYATILIKCALLLSNKIITVSQFSKSEIIRYFKVNAANIYPVHLGVDKHVFRKYDLLEQQRVQKDYKLPDFFLLYVGNVKPHKNLKVLIEAFALIKEKHLVPGLKLVIVGKKEGFITGDTKLFNDIQAKGLADDITFTGYVKQTDLPIIYNIASIFVFPSKYEGFGLPPLEAMACGCPAVVSKGSSIPEVCQYAAAYFNPDNAEELVSIIIKIINSNALKEQMRLNGFKLANSYNWDITSQKLSIIIKAA